MVGWEGGVDSLGKYSVSGIEEINCNKKGDQ